MLQDVEGKAVEVVQDFVHLMRAPPGGSWPGGRPGRSEDAASTAGVLFSVLRACGIHSPRRPASGRSDGASRQAVQRRTQRLEAERQAGGVERIVGRGRAARRTETAR